MKERLREILIEFAERCHEAEESVRVPPPDDEVDKAVEAIAPLLRNPVADFLMNRPPSRDGMPDSSLRIGVGFEAGEDHEAYESWGWVVEQLQAPQDETERAPFGRRVKTIAEGRSLQPTLDLARERLQSIFASPPGDTAKSGAAQDRPPSAQTVTCPSCSSGRVEPIPGVERTTGPVGNRVTMKMARCLQCRHAFWPDLAPDPDDEDALEQLAADEQARAGGDVAREGVATPHRPEED
jgi:hypothetical protein